MMIISPSDFTKLSKEAVVRFTQDNIEEGTELPSFDVLLLSQDLVIDTYKATLCTTLNDNMFYESVYRDDKLYLNAFRKYGSVTLDITHDNEEEVNDDDEERTEV